jgi:hypothetical protein
MVFASTDLPEETLLLPFPAFVVAACEWIDGYEWGNGDEPMFHFVRCLKAHPGTGGMDADRAYESVMNAFRQQRRDPQVARMDLTDDDDIVTFYRMWERVRFAMGADPVDVACSLAGEGLIKTNKRRPGKYERFLTVAALLQVQRRQLPVFLPARKLAAHMPCEPNTVTSWIGWAREDEVLVKTRAHSFRSAGESGGCQDSCRLS